VCSRFVRVLRYIRSPSVSCSPHDGDVSDDVWLWRTLAGVARWEEGSRHMDLLFGGYCVIGLCSRWAAPAVLAARSH